jgi:hypothetical protein
LIADALAIEWPLPETEAKVIDLLSLLRNDFITTEIKRLAVLLNHPDTDAARQKEISDCQKELRSRRQQPLG